MPTEIIRDYTSQFARQDSRTREIIRHVWLAAVTAALVSSCVGFSIGWALHP